MPHQMILLRRLTLSALIAAATQAFASSPVPAQEAEPRASTTETLRVFIDCRSRLCDFDHFRREITFVNYMRQRQDAQVHVLITTRRTGGGGTEFTFAFIGQQEFQSVDDSLQYYSGNTDTEDEVRAGITRTLKFGLVRYAARTAAAERLDVVYEAPEDAETTPQAVEDPWNFWIFRMRVGGFVTGEELQSFFDGFGSLSANRTTEEWKISLSASGSYAEDHFELSDGTELVSVSRSYGGEIFAANSLSDHWSAGGVVEARASTFRNHDLRLELGPAVEYNIFPYAESTRRELKFLYVVQLNYFDYDEITIFDKLSETRLAHFFEVSYSVQQPFGSIRTSFEASSFLDNFRQHSLELSGRLDVRLVKGLEFDLGGRVERTKNQIQLPRAGATDEEVLLRRRELGTEYRYFIDFGLSYTFGSIFNNVVNPRFD